MKGEGEGLRGEAVVQNVVEVDLVGVKVEVAQVGIKGAGEGEVDILWLRVR